MSSVESDALSTLPQFPQLRILLVEDNARLRRLMHSSLETLGCDVRVAGDAAEALQVLDDESPQVLVSDVRMPGAIDGIELARRARQKHAGLRVLLLTGFSTAVAPGFTMLHKPFTLEELAASLAGVIGAAAT